MARVLPIRKGASQRPKVGSWRGPACQELTLYCQILERSRSLWEWGQGDEWWNWGLEQCLFTAFQDSTAGFAAPGYRCLAFCLPHHLRKQSSPFLLCLLVCLLGGGGELLIKSIKGSEASTLFSTPASLPHPQEVSVPPAYWRGARISCSRFAADKTFPYLESVFIFLSCLKFVFSGYELLNLRSFLPFST